MNQRRVSCALIASALLSFCGFTADDAKAAYLGNIKRAVCASAAHEVDPAFLVQSGLTGGCLIQNTDILSHFVHYSIPVERSSSNTTLQVAATTTTGGLTGQICLHSNTFAADGSLFSSAADVCSTGTAVGNQEVLGIAVVLPPGGAAVTHVTVGYLGIVYTLKVGYVSNGT